MIELLTRLDRHLAGKSLHSLGDSAYTAPVVLNRIPRSIAVTGRVGDNVRLHEAAPPRRPGQTGRPRKRGQRLPTPAEMLRSKGLRRLSLQLYAGTEYRVRTARPFLQGS